MDPVPGPGATLDPRSGAAAPRSVDLVRIALPLHRPHAAAHGSEAIRDLILVRMVLEGGSVGWGECSTLAQPTYTAEYTAGAWSMLRDVLVPAVLAGTSPGVVGHPMATAGLVTAWTDAALRMVGRSLAASLASGPDEAPSATVPTCAVVGRRAAVDAVLVEVAERVEAQVAMVKLKVTSVPEDLAAVEAVRRTWPELALAVDFNGTADLAALRRLDPLGLAYVEQPAPADALVTSAHFAGNLGCPVALDESITSPGMLDAAVALGAGSMVNVKPARCGGPEAAAAMVRRARGAGLEVFVGGMLESGVGRAASLAVAALVGGAIATDLGPSLAYVDVDVTEPLDADAAGRMVIPDGPGIGRVPIAEHLERCTVERMSIGR